VLLGAGLSDLPFFPIPNALPVAMWLLAVASLVTVGQRLHAVRSSPGAVDRIELPEKQMPAGGAETGEQ
ncbi:MAG: CDP-diacylglycerol--inositol 3-phosphatidyltransferase, partial [Mycobacterium sp.]|nr:CDP-diacylglycerol--inositol 3-phosphatidyltransferase [Mycobacterium sp.]